MDKIPCATCPDICENAVGLYRAYHLLKDVKMEKMGLQCHKTGLYYEFDLRQELPTNLDIPGLRINGPRLS